MHITRTGMLAATLAMAVGSAMSAAVPMEPDAPEPERGSARNKPSGSRPVPGGGARERARRLARLSKQQPD